MYVGSNEIVEMTGYQGLGTITANEMQGGELGRHMWQQPGGGWHQHHPRHVVRSHGRHLFGEGAAPAPGAPMPMTAMQPVSDSKMPYVVAGVAVLGLAFVLWQTLKD